MKHVPLEPIGLLTHASSSKKLNSKYTLPYIDLDTIRTGEMASQQDLQELLRLLTLGKVPIKDAMMRVKALQAKNLRTYATVS